MISIAIPSYQRAETLKSKTLAYLQSTDFDMSRVFVFVADEQQRQEYESYGIPNLIVGVPTIKGQRNFIRNYFAEGERVFSIDDDVVGLYRASHSIRRLNKFAPVTDLTAFLQDSFDLCSKIRTKLFGVNPILNPMFMFGKRNSHELRYIVGAAFGQIIDHDNALRQTINDKGDYERSIKYFIKFRSVLRINSVSVSTNYYSEKGGMQVERTKERVKESALYLSKMYPEFCEMNTKKTNQTYAEIRLRYKKEYA